MAVCDTARTLATPLATVNRVGDRRAEHDRIAELAAEHEVTTVVVGLPLALDGGDDNPAVRLVRSELKALRRRLAPAEVVTHDERLTTRTAHSSLRSGGVGGRRAREVVDQVAAAVILQAWIDGPGSTG